MTRYYDVKLTDLLSKRRHKSITVLARSTCGWLDATQFSLEVGGYFGGRDHTTVMHAIGRSTGVRTSSSFSDDIDRLETAVLDRHA